MKGTLVVLFLLILTSCQPRQETIAESRRDAIVDSLVALRMEEITRLATEDLDRRRAIEVKAKADSIVEAFSGRSAPSAPDTKPRKQITAEP